MRILTLSTSIFALTLGGGTAFAQEASLSSGISSDSAAASAAGLLVSESVANGPTDRPLGSNLVPHIQLQASAGEKTASLTWSFNISSSRVNRLAYTQFSMSVETSVDDAEGDTQLFGLRGFSGGTEVKLSLTHFFGNIRIPDARGLQEDNQLIAATTAICEADIRLTQEQRSNGCSEDDANYPGISAAIERHNLPGLAAHIRRRFAPVFPFLGVEIGGNQDRYNFLDRTAFAMDKVSRFGFDATLFGGVLFTRSLTSITGSFTYSRRYEAQRSVTICQAINPTQQQCLTGADGRPDENRRAILAVELRHAFRTGVGTLPRFAIAPEFSIDLHNNSYAIDVPIYLAQASNGQLRGGVRLGYVNQRDGNGGREGEFSVGVFVGVPFKLFR